MRRTLGLAATCLLSTLVLAGCGGTSNLVNPQPSATPLVPSVTGEVAVPTAGSAPTSITRGSDGNMWFVERTSGKVGKIVTSTATITEPASAQLPVGSNPVSIVTGSDANLWITESGTDKIAQVSTGGTLQAEFSLSPGANPQQIINGPDGNLWFTEAGRGATPNRIGNITPLGVVTEFNIPTANAGLGSIAVNIADGSLWFTESTVSKVARITTGGNVTAEIPTATPNAQPFQVVLGGDGAMWFTEAAVDRIGRVTSGSPATDYSLAPTAASVSGIVVGQDNKFYIADYTADKIIQVATTSTPFAVAAYTIPTATAFTLASSFPGMFAIGYDGKIYFTESNANKIGQFTYF